MFYLVIAFFFGLAGGVIGRIKGSSFFMWFLISAAVPLFGLAAAMLYRYESDEPDRECPRCGRPCKIYAALCMRCGMELEFPEHQHSATIGTTAA